MSLSRRPFPLLLLLSICAPLPAIAQGPAVSGVVLDPGDRPLAGATVALYGAPARLELADLLLAGKAPPEAVAAARSDADGRFRLEAPGPGLYTVAVGHEGRVPLEHAVEPLLGDVDLAPVHLLPDAGLTVEVVDSEGRPVAGARVRFLGQGPPDRPSDWRPWSWKAPSRRTAQTGPRGRASLARFAGEAGTVRVTAPGASASAELASGAGGRSLRVKLAPVPVRLLRVVGKEGRPVAGAVAWTGGFDPVGATGDDGLLDLPLGEAEAVSIHVDAPGGLVADLEVPAAGEDDDAGPFPVLLAPVDEVVGRVVAAADGSGIAGALVWPTLDPGSAVVSGRGGAFRLPMLRFAVGGELAAAAAGFLTAGGPAGKRAGEPVEDPVLALPPAARLAGRVVDGSGRPLARVELRASPFAHQGLGYLTTPQPRIARSGGEGRFHIDGLPRGVVVEVRARLDGYAPWEEPIAPESSTSGVAAAPAGFPDVEIVLSAGARVRGRLIDEEGEPVVGADVALVPRDARPDPWAMEPGGLERAVSGADGVFEIVDLPIGRVDLEVAADGHPRLSRPGIEVQRLGETVDLGDLELGPEAVLEGVVEDPRGVTIAGALVRVASEERRRSWIREPSGQDPGTATSGVDGGFRVEGLTPGTGVIVTAAKEGYASGASVGARLPIDEPVHVVLQPAARISGRVLDESERGLSGAYVHTDGGFQGWGGPPSRGQTDDAGAFVIEAPAGAVRVTAQKAGFKPADPVLLELEPGEHRDSVELVLAPAPQVSGQVLLPGGEPALGSIVTVSVMLGSGAGSSHGRSVDVEGRFALDVPEGRVRVEASKEGYATVARELDVTAEGATVVLRLTSGVEVSGRLLGSDGEPVAGRGVGLTAVGGISRTTQNAVSAGEGSFSIRGVGDGTYRLFVEPERVTSRRRGNPYQHPDAIVVEGGSPISGIVVRLPAQVTIRGRLLGLAPEELGATTVVATGDSSEAGGARPGTVLDGGLYEVADLAPGRWQVTASVPSRGKSGRGSTEIAPGQEVVHLDLELHEGLTVTGTVRWNGVPAPGVRVHSSGTSGGATVTGSGGRFELHGLDPGRQHLVLVDPARAAGASRTVEVYGGEDLLLDVDTVPVRGSVLTAIGMAPLSGVRVMLADEGADGQLTVPRTSTAADGTFLFEAVEPGSYQLRVEQAGYGAQSLGVEVPRGGTALPPVVLESVTATELRVRGADGAPAERIVLSARGADGVSILETWAVSLGGGRFVVDTLPPGRWELVVRALDGAVGRAVAVVPGPPVGIVLAPPEDAEPAPPE